VTADDFRGMALSFADTCEAAHMGHPDFRVAGKIFATLGPKEAWGMVKLTPEERARFMAAEPEVFSAASGAWGRRGCTIVCLELAKKRSVRKALAAAWRKTSSEDPTSRRGSWRRRE
jgi:hypothetical protein